jgi:hypothetical protein
MSASRRDLTHLIALGSAAGLIGIPVALVARTWIPLETSRRDTGTTPGEPESDLDVQQGNRDRNQNNRRRDRQPKEPQHDNPRAGASSPER